jgi:endoglucanase
MPHPTPDQARPTARQLQTLRRLTGLPTATGHEDRVVRWVRQWAQRRPEVEVKQDRHGNLLLKRRGDRRRRPILLTAHLDHPAFVVTEVEGKTLTAEFRGGVQDDYFVGSPVRLFRQGRGSKPIATGKVTELHAAVPRPEGRGFKTASIELSTAVKAKPGDLLTWDLPDAEAIDGRLHAPACDDLAGLAAMFEAFDQWLKIDAERTETQRNSPGASVRLLCTRAEEIGFVGAIGACRSGLIPKGARLVALEASKASAEAPIGGGPIVRVGDRTSTFDPVLTYAVGQVAQRLAAEDPSFAWQRKLMTGGTCEASAYQALGHTATCVCLPLGHYHNMNPTTGRIDREIIGLADYHGLVRLLLAIATTLDDPAATPSLTDRLHRLFDEQREVLDRPVEV